MKKIPDAVIVATSVACTGGEAGIGTMPDRIKVIEGLRHCRRHMEAGKGCEVQCPLYGQRGCSFKLMDEAIALLTAPDLPAREAGEREKKLDTAHQLIALMGVSLKQSIKDAELADALLAAAQERP